MLENKLKKEVVEKAKKIKLLIMDCDGVLTDGKLYFSENGEELKVFNVKDGQGIKNWHNAGFTSGVITGRKSIMLERRVKELGIHYLKQSSEDKVKDLGTILNETKLSVDQVAYIGDDISDLELLKKVGLPIAVSDSSSEIFSSVSFITSKKGGEGAVREVIEMLLKSK